MQEWLNWPAWKASKRQKRFRGSNPLLSATASQTDSRTNVLLLFVLSKSLTNTSYVLATTQIDIRHSVSA